MVATKVQTQLELGLIATAAALAALPVGALLLLAALFLGMGRGGPLAGRQVGCGADLLGHGAA